MNIKRRHSLDTSRFKVDYMLDRKSTVNMWSIFLDTMQKIWPENSLPLPKNRKKTKGFHSVMTPAAMFTQSQNPSNFVRILTLRYTDLYE